MENLKPFLEQFIQYYYRDLGNSTGGYLHICLDDGNLEPNDIWLCQQECEKHKDSFGFFLASLMRSFNTEELEIMYERNWGMTRSNP